MKIAAALPVLTLLFSIAYAHAEGGSASSGGGDLLPLETGTAWFLGPREVSTCLEMGPNFEISVTEAARRIQAAAVKWQSYLTEHGVWSLESYSSPQNRPGLNLAIHSRCSGQEELKIYLGSRTPEVDAIREQFSDPIAFAHRTHFDPSNGSSRGLIWISEKPTRTHWSVPLAFESVVMHELGHVLGFGHMTGTIMTGDIGHLLQTAAIAQPSISRHYLNTIDHNRELVPHFLGSGQYTGFLTQAAMELLSDPKGNASTTAQARFISKSEMQMTWESDGRVKTAGIQVIGQGSQFTGQGEGLKVFRNDPKNLLYAWISTGGGEMNLGQLALANGRSLAVLMTRNSDTGIFRITTFAQGEERVLFSTIKSSY